MLQNAQDNLLALVLPCLHVSAQRCYDDSRQKQFFFHKARLFLPTTLFLFYLICENATHFQNVITRCVLEICCCLLATQDGTARMYYYALSLFFFLFYFFQTGFSKMSTGPLYLGSRYAVAL